MKILAQTVMIGLLASNTCHAEKVSLYDSVKEKIERNKGRDFIAVATVRLPLGTWSTPEKSALLKAMVQEMRFLVYPDGNTLLGMQTLWCAEEDFDAASKWLVERRSKFSEVIEVY